MVELDAAATPATVIAARGGESAAPRARESTRLPAPRPPRARRPASGVPWIARSPPALTRHGAGRREQSAQPDRRRSPSRCHRDRAGTPARSRFVEPVDGDAAAAGGSGRDRGPVRRDVVERAVVAGRHDRVVHRRIEAPAGTLARVQREPRHLDESGRRVERPAGVEHATAPTSAGSASSIRSSRWISLSARASAASASARRRRRGSARRCEPMAVERRAASAAASSVSGRGDSLLLRRRLRRGHRRQRARPAPAAVRGRSGSGRGDGHGRGWGGGRRRGRCGGGLKPESGPGPADVVVSGALAGDSVTPGAAARVGTAALPAGGRRPDDDVAAAVSSVLSDRETARRGGRAALRLQLLVAPRQRRSPRTRGPVLSGRTATCAARTAAACEASSCCRWRCSATAFCHRRRADLLLVDGPATGRRRASPRAARFCSLFSRCAQGCEPRVLRRHLRRSSPTDGLRSSPRAGRRRRSRPRPCRGATTMVRHRLSAPAACLSASHCLSASCLTCSLFPSAARRSSTALLVDRQRLRRVPSSWAAVGAPRARARCGMLLRRSRGGRRRR